MGHVVAKAKLYNPGDPSKNLEVELLVDTGSTYSWIKRDKLEELGLKPMTRWKFKTIEGKIVERDIGEVVVECLGERATTVAVFAENGGRGGTRCTCHGGPEARGGPGDEAT